MKLNQWSKRQGISITFLAALLHVDRSYIHKWRSGRRVPSPKIMKKLKELSLGEVKETEDLKDEEKSTKRKKRTKNVSKKINPKVKRD